MDEGQRKLLDLMMHFDKQCKKYEIKYFLGGGSALGAVRHRGFLPWDDDVDLYIPRAEYDKIYKLKDEFFSDEFVLVSHEEFDTYGNTLVRCVDTNSTAITKARIVDGTPKGQFVELFIMDPMPRDKKEQNTWLKKHWIYTELLSTTFRTSNARIADWLDWDLYREYKTRCENEGRQTILNELNNELFTISEEEADEYCVRWGFRNIIYDIDWFQKQRYVPFEHTSLPVASDAENVLRVDYGDSWMYIPVQDEKIVHTITSSMTIPYAKFMEDYLQFFNPNEVSKYYEPRKEAAVKWYELKYKCVSKAQYLKQIAIKMEMDSVDTCSMRKLLNQGKYGDVENIYANWFNEQTGEAFWQYSKYLVIGDDNLYCALIPQLKQGKYSFVSKVLDWRIKECGELSNELLDVKNYVNRLRKAYQCAERGKWLEIREILPPENIVANQFDCKYLELLSDVKSSDGSNAELLMKREEIMEKNFPDNGEIISLKGDIEYLMHQNENAVRSWIKAFENTRNGLVQLHIKDMLSKMEEGSI